MKKTDEQYSDEIQLIAFPKVEADHILFGTGYLGNSRVHMNSASFRKGLATAAIVAGTIVPMDLAAQATPSQENSVARTLDSDYASVEKLKQSERMPEADTKKLSKVMKILEETRQKNPLIWVAASSERHLLILQADDVGEVSLEHFCAASTLDERSARDVAEGLVKYGLLETETKREGRSFFHVTDLGRKVARVIKSCNRDRIAGTDISAEARIS